MMSDPDFFPFCLSPQYWPDAQRAHFRGLVGQTTYQPPSYWQSVGSDAAKLIGPVFIGAVAATFLPEELVGGGRRPSSHAHRREGNYRERDEVRGEDNHGVRLGSRWLCSGHLTLGSVLIRRGPRHRNVAPI